MGQGYPGRACIGLVATNDGTRPPVAPARTLVGRRVPERRVCGWEGTACGRGSVAGLYAWPIRRPYIVGTTPQQQLERVQEQVLHGLADRAACRRRTASLVAHTVIGAWEAHLVRDLAHAHEACGERLVRAHDSDSTGWMLFRVRGDSQAEYVAVRRETGEV